jgi:hypothetical protein
LATVAVNACQDLAKLNEPNARTSGIAITLEILIIGRIDKKDKMFKITATGGRGGRLLRK